jgi:hypothetical protein
MRPRPVFRFMSGSSIRPVFRSRMLAVSMALSTTDLSSTIQVTVSYTDPAASEPFSWIRIRSFHKQIPDSDPALITDPAHDSKNQLPFFERVYNRIRSNLDRVRDTGSDSDQLFPDETTVQISQERMVLTKLML